EKAIRQSRAQFVYTGESVTGLGFIFGYLEVVASADFDAAFLAGLAAVKPEDVQRVVRTYLNANNRTVGWFVPQEDESATTENPAEAAPGVYPLCWLGTKRGPRFGIYTERGPCLIMGAYSPVPTMICFSVTW